MNLEQLISQANTIGISGHVRPDGDCVGSTMALYHYIKKHHADKEVRIYLEEIPDVFRFFSNSNEIKHEADEITFDLFFCLDCGALDRLGPFAEMFEKAKVTACIDHHKSNTGFAMYNEILPDISSTSELIFQLLDKEKITNEIAECLYTGMVHDTGVFQYSCTSAQTMASAGFLMDLGIDYSRIIDETYYEKTYDQNRILAKTVLESKCYEDGKIIYSLITEEDMKRYNVSSKDLDGIVNQLRITKGVEVAVFVYELQAGEYKVSMRSKRSVDVSSIAVMYGGGGHARAAGFSIKDHPDAICKLTIEAIKEQL